MNKLELQTRLGRTLGITKDEDDNPDEWEMMGQVLSEGIVDILSRTRVHVKCLTISLIGGEDEYELDDDILRLYNLRRSDSTADLEEYHPAELDRYSGAGAFSIIGYNRIRLAWEPSAGDSLKCWYTPRPTPLGAPTDDPADIQFGNIPAEFHPAILTYACWKMADASGDDASRRGEKYRIDYEGKDGIGIVGSELGKIKMAINGRVTGNAKNRRQRRALEYLEGDLTPGYWQG